MIITLLGYMGSGKSTAGKKLAHKLKYDFIDLDDFIENQFDSSIADIFKNKGEHFFRLAEQAALKKCLQQNNIVLSLGGGTPCFYDNIELVNKYSTSIYLKMNSKALASRLEGEQAKRPLISGFNKEELICFIDKNLIKREPFYSQAKHTIEATSLKTSDLLFLLNL